MEEDHKSEKLKLKLKFTFKQNQEQQKEEVIELVQQTNHLHQAQTLTSFDKKDDGVDDLEDGVDDTTTNNNNNNGEAGESDSPSLLLVSKKRVCPVCSREFINGKALGGHMRVHQENQQPKSRPIGSGPNPSREDQAAVHACTHCHKEFPSAKALFGHMRSHPERDYRGMQPPGQHHSMPWWLSRCPDKAPMDPGQGSGSGQLVLYEPPEAAADRVLELGWRMTRKRGQRAYQSSSESEEQKRAPKAYRYQYRYRTESEKKLASELMCFANGESGGERKDVTSTKKKLKLKKKGELDEVDEYYLNHEVELSIESSLNSYNPLSLDLPLNSDDPIKSLEHVGSNSKSVLPKMKIKSKKKKGLAINEGKKKTNKKTNFNKLMASIRADDDSHDHDDNDDDDDDKKLYGHDDDDDDDDDDGDDETEVKGEDKKQWKCSTCNKTFPTHQALGGHRSSHNKDKLLQTPQIKIPNPNYAPLTLTRTHIESGSGFTHVGPGSDERDDGSGGDGSGSGSGSRSGSGSGSGSPNSEMLLQYKCKTCGDSFSSGRALGGHQRCHYTPPSSESSPEQTSSPTDRRGAHVFDIDLNLLAEEEEEHGAV